jgi:hypothetical protein
VTVTDGPLYSVDGLVCGLEGLRERIARSVASASRDREGLSTLRITLTACPAAPYGNVQAAMRACAEAGAWVVEWRLGDATVEATIHRDRTPPPFDQLSFAEHPVTVRVRGRLVQSGAVSWHVNRIETSGQEGLLQALRVLKERCAPTAELDVAHDVPYRDAFAALRTIRSVPMDMLMPEISVPAPPGPDNPWIRGMSDANRDASRGHLVLISYGLPGDSCFFIQNALLRIRYGVVSDHRGCCIDEGDDAYAEAYNFVSRKAILDKFRRDVEAECSRDAKALSPEVLAELRGDEEARFLLGLE